MDLVSIYLKNKKNNKWTLIFHIINVAPAIGTDIVKRQARERLARINAFNMIAITIVCTVGVIIRSLDSEIFQQYNDILKVPSAYFIVICFLFSLIFSYEYYKRRCWNNDLLIKVLPTIDSNTRQPD